MIQLRDYQERAISDLRAALGAGRRRPLLVMPTGSGKTVVAKEIIDSAVAKGSRVLVLAPRRELIYQTADHLAQAGIDHAMYMAGEQSRVMAPVQVASIPTLHSRMQRGRTVAPHANLLIVDEAHLSIAPTTLKVLAEYENVPIVGLTATPARGDGRGLGEVYDEMVMGPSVKDLTARGHLVPVKYFVPSIPDLEGVKIQMGDYNAKELAERMDRPTLIGDVVENWLRICPDRSTVVFSVNVAHSISLCDRFREVGVDAAHVDASTPLDERKEIMANVRSGEIQVVCNCEVMTYGIDIPRLSCAVIARPTKSIVRYLQGAGRVLRPYGDDDSEDKKHDTIVIDHAGVVGELGLVDEERPWSLDGKGRIQDRWADRPRTEPKPIMCPHCMATFIAQRTCPNCGADLAERYAKHISAFEADLVARDAEDKRLMRRLWTKAEKMEFMGELKGYAIHHHYKPGWAAYKYKEKFGVWPPSEIADAEACSVGRTTESWIRSRQIAWAKEKQRAEKAEAASAD